MRFGGSTPLGHPAFELACTLKKDLRKGVGPEGVLHAHCAFDVNHTLVGVTVRTSHVHHDTLQSICLRLAPAAYS